MDSDRAHNAPTSKQAIAATISALLNLAVTFLMVLIAANTPGNWLFIALFIGMLMLELALISMAIAEWCKYFRNYVDFVVRRQ